MHSKGLEVSPVRVIEAESHRNAEIKSQILNTTHEQLWLELAKDLTPHKKYFIQINFEGKLAEDLKGLYKSSYIDRATQTER